MTSCRWCGNPAKKTCRLCNKGVCRLCAFDDTRERTKGRICRKDCKPVPDCSTLEHFAQKGLHPCEKCNAIKPKNKKCRFCAADEKRARAAFAQSSSL